MEQSRRKFLWNAALAKASVLAIASPAFAQNNGSDRLLEVIEEKAGDSTAHYKRNSQSSPISKGSSKIFSPKDFGALGDGKNNDTIAINHMFAAMKDGDLAIFPKGEYVVAPEVENDYILKLPDKQNIAIRGEARGSVYLKIANGSGNYLGIMGFKGAKKIENLVITQLTFDHNQAGNSFSNAKDYTRLGRYSIALYPPAIPEADHIFEEIDVINCDSVVSIYIPQGNKRNNSIIIRACRWLELANKLGENYDQSIINVAGNQVLVCDNIFRGASWGRGLPRTCIETHASNQIIMGNNITKVQVGMNLTGVTREGEDRNILCTGNIIEVSNDAIFYWSNNFGETHNNLALDGIMISNNIIRIHPLEDAYTRKSTCGIFLFGGQRAASIKNIKISGNYIVYPETPTYFNKNSLIRSRTGIGWQLKGEETSVENVVFENNTVVNSPSSAFYIDQGRVDGLSIINNSIISPVNAIETQHGSAIYISASLQNTAFITGNIFSISSDKGAGSLFFLQDLSKEQSSIEIKNNSYNITKKSLVHLKSIILPQKNTSTSINFYDIFPFSRDDILYPSLGNDGSGVIHCVSNGAEYFFVSGENQRWIANFRTVFSPHIPGKQGDIIQNAAPSLGQPLSWHHTGSSWEEGVILGRPSSK